MPVNNGKRRVRVGASPRRPPVHLARSHPRISANGHNAKPALQIDVCIVPVPPDILDYPTSTDMVVREGSNVTLRCAATGTPEPTVTWRRETGGIITLSSLREGEYFSLRTLCFLTTDLCIDLLICLFNF